MWFLGRTAALPSVLLEQSGLLACPREDGDTHKHSATKDMENPPGHGWWVLDAARIDSSSELPGSAEGDQRPGIP